MTHAHSHAVALAALVAILAKPSSAVAAIPPDAMTRQQALERFRSGQKLLLTDAFAAAAVEFQAAIDLDPGMALAHYGWGSRTWASRGMSRPSRPSRAAATPTPNCPPRPSTATCA